MKGIRHIRITIWTYVHVCIEVVDEDGDKRSSSDEDDVYENGYDNDDSSYDSDDER
jgi:hypothetical protein